MATLSWVLVLIFIIVATREGYSSNQQETRQGPTLQLSDGSILTAYGQNHQGYAQGYQSGYQLGYQLGYPTGYQSWYSPIFPQYPFPAQYYPDYQYEEPKLSKQQPAESNFATTLLLFFAFSGIFTPSITDPPNTTLPPVPVTTEFDGTCKWGAWTSCSSICKGTRSRERMCQGSTQSESENCNTEMGFRPDGKWYRASNCYDYFWSDEEVVSKEAAEEACASLNARLASAGLRDDSVRVDVVTSIATLKGVENMGSAHVGISNKDEVNVYVWSDGFRGYPTFFEDKQPNDGATECLLLSPGTSHGLWDRPTCIDPFNSRFLCERAAQ